MNGDALTEQKAPVQPWNWAHVFQAQLNASAASSHVSAPSMLPPQPAAVVGGLWNHQWNAWAQHQAHMQHSVTHNHSKYRLNGNSNAGGGGGKPENQKKEENDDVWSYLEAQAAFLGPSLWENGGLKMEYMDLDEFLSENGMPIGAEANKEVAAASPHQASSSSKSPATSNDSNDAVPALASSSRHSSNATPVDFLNQNFSPAETEMNDDDSASGCSSALEEIAPEACMPVRSAAPAKRKRTAISVASSTSDNTSDDGSYVPGHDFDPKSRPFSQEELRPQPMSKKSKKQYVPDDLKDDKYWARRRKNNMAAKRSRDARRVKENQIAMRAAFLEKENAVLRAELDKMTKLYTSALKRLEQYEKPANNKKY